MNKFKILEIACNIIWELDIQSKCRKIEYIKARFCFYALSRDHITTNVSSMARYMKKEHATVINALEKNKISSEHDVIEGMKKVEILYKKMEYDCVVNELTEIDYDDLTKKAIEGINSDNVIIKKLSIENEKLFRELQEIKNKKENELPTWLLKILNYPKEVQEEFRDTRFKLFDKMIDSRKYSIRE